MLPASVIPSYKSLCCWAGYAFEWFEQPDVKEGAVAVEEGAVAVEEGAVAVEEEGAVAVEEGAVAAEEGAATSTACSRRMVLSG